MFDVGRALVAAGLLGLSMPVTAGVAIADPGESAPVTQDDAIINGIPTILQPTTGAMLFTGPDERNQFLDCTGVLIGCRTVLTAAHCLCPRASNYSECVEEIGIHDCDWNYFLQHGSIYNVRDVFVHPDYVPGLNADLAVVRLAQLVTGIEPSPIHKGDPQNILRGTEGIVAGYGSSRDERLTAGIKRVGSIVTSACPAQHGVTEPANICWDFDEPILDPGEEVNLCLLDDGGPVFMEFGEGPVVAGINTGGGPSCAADSYSFAASVRYSADWISAVGGPDIERDQCSDLGEVGRPWVLVQGGTGRLPRNDTEEHFSFDIPKETLLLRVTVNGDSERSGDYDLFVGLGQKVPTREDNDCQVRGAGQFGACEFDEPEVARVNVMIRHVRPEVGRGLSRFQVTVTAFQEVPPADDPPRGPDNLRYRKRGPGFRELLWFDDSDNELGFEMQRRPGTGSTTPFTFLGTRPANYEEFLDQIPDNSVFTYRVRAFNLWGESEWSNLCVVNKKRDRRPSRFRVTDLTSEKVSLKWKDRSDEIFFQMQRRNAGSKSWKTIGLPPADSTTFTDRNVTPGKSYEYRVRGRANTSECLKDTRYSAIREVTIPLD